jgi:hypothetical protein
MLTEDVLLVERDREKGKMPALASIKASTAAKSRTVRTIPNFRME